MHVTLIYLMNSGFIREKFGKAGAEKTKMTAFIITNSILYILSTIYIFYDGVLGNGLIIFFWCMDTRIFCMVNAFLANAMSGSNAAASTTAGAPAAKSNIIQEKFNAAGSSSHALEKAVIERSSSANNVLAK
jgi:hypothetical protein